MDDGVGRDILPRLEGREIVVGADDGTVQGSQAAGQFLQPVVELMVAQGHAVISHRVHDFDLQIPVQDGEIRGSLAEVAGVQEQDVVLSAAGTDTVHEGSPLDHAARAVTERIEMTVRVVGMEDDELASGGRAGRQAQGQDGRQ